MRYSHANRIWSELLLSRLLYSMLFLIHLSVYCEDIIKNCCNTHPHTIIIMYIECNVIFSGKSFEKNWGIISRTSFECLLPPHKIAFQFPFHSAYRWLSFKCSLPYLWRTVLGFCLISCSSSATSAHTLLCMCVILGLEPHSFSIINVFNLEVSTGLFHIR